MLPRYLVSWFAENYRSPELKVRECDFLVLGSGVAGLWSALNALPYGRVAVVTKSVANECNTHYAQGGMAAALCPKDSPEQHFEDTVNAAAGLCNEEAAWVLVNEAPKCILELREMGAQFDEEEGQLLLGREGAHGVRRIVHAKGDATGREVERALLERVRALGVELFEETFAIDLITVQGECVGALVWELDESLPTLFLASATLLCTGGAGQLYAATTNPSVTSGDGIAMAYRAGAEVMDLEFFQFHPTALVEQTSPRLLISEAVRGEGAILKDARGQPFMQRYHPDGELAPRDVVARAIFKEIHSTGVDYVFLDVSHMGEEFVRRRFPTICYECLERGFDMAKGAIPVAPAAHYLMGGVKTDLWGRTNIPRLFACGEAACTGLHGANRLASNSLTEGLVFGRRAVRGALSWIGKPLPALKIPELVTRQSSFIALTDSLDGTEQQLQLQSLMSRNVGIVRHAEGLREAQMALEGMSRQIYHITHITHICPEQPNRTAWEVANLLTIAQLMVCSALLRTESRGAHYREDFPERDDEHWLRRIVLRAEYEADFLKPQPQILWDKVKQGQTVTAR